MPHFVADAPRHRRKFLLSFTDNVPFGDTSRAEATLTFIPILYFIFIKNASVCVAPSYIFLLVAQNTDMGLIFIRTIVIFITLLVIMRLMGKRQIGEMQPYELVITLIIADLACIPMADTSIPLLYGVIAILTVYFLHQVVCALGLKFSTAKTILSGSPSVVLNKNGVDDTELKKNNLNVSDLIESLRTEGYFSLDAVDYALYEAEGTFSALPKKNYDALQTSLPVILIDEGKFDKRNLERTAQSKEYFLRILREHGCDDEKNVLVMTVDGNGKVYLQKRKGKYTVFSLNWNKKIW